MLLFYLPLILFEAMLPSPKRKASKATSEKRSTSKVPKSSAPWKPSTLPVPAPTAMIQ